MKYTRRNARSDWLKAIYHKLMKNSLRCLKLALPKKKQPKVTHIHIICKLGHVTYYDYNVLKKIFKQKWHQFIPSVIYFCCFQIVHKVSNKDSVPGPFAIEIFSLVNFENKPHFILVPNILIQIKF